MLVAGLRSLWREHFGSGRVLARPAAVAPSGGTKKRRPGGGAAEGTSAGADAPLTAREMAAALLAADPRQGVFLYSQAQQMP